MNLLDHLAQQHRRAKTFSKPCIGAADQGSPLGDPGQYEAKVRATT